tara:strand:- start:323 stop:682 length:360 start_codon:yes stop_codon:yes gene_type:complete
MFFSVTRYSRAKKFLEEKLSKKELEEEFHRTGIKLNSLETIRFITFILLYSSLVSTFLSIIPGIEIITQNILRVSGLIGSTVFLIIIAIASKLIANYTIDLTLYGSALKNVRRTRKKKK